MSEAKAFVIGDDIVIRLDGTTPDKWWQRRDAIDRNLKFSIGRTGRVSFLRERVVWDGNETVARDKWGNYRYDEHGRVMRGTDDAEINVHGTYKREQKWENRVAAIRIKL